MSFHAIPIGAKAPKILNVVIEIPRGGHNKYEYDEELDVIRLDRVLHSALFYPVDYGFVPETRADDGDHLDVLVVTDSPAFPGCLLEVRPIGVLHMSDESGIDHKILAVPLKNPHYQDIKSIRDFSTHKLNEIVNFFETYKLLEHKDVKVKGWGNTAEAYKVIKHARDVFTKEHAAKQKNH